MTEQKPYYIHALLLAAGQSKRFESPKQLALINGIPMITHSTLTMQKSDFNKMSVVLGAKSKDVEQALEHINVNSEKSHTISSVFAKNWQHGMGASIDAGVQCIFHDVTHICIGLADQVEISSNQYNVMISASKKNPLKIIAASYNQRLGAPAIFPQAYFAELAVLDNDEGARSILRANKNAIIAIELPEAAKDIDTQLDLQTYISNTYKGRKHD